MPSNPPTITRPQLTGRRLALALAIVLVVAGLGLRAIVRTVAKERRAARAEAFVERARQTAPVARTPTQRDEPTAIPDPVLKSVRADGSAKKNPSTHSDELFAGGLIPRLLIEIPEPGMNTLRRRSRDYVRATIREGDTVYTNVAIHLKGGPGSFRPIDDTPSYTLNFEKLAEGQKFHGLKKIHLNSSIQDPSYLSEMISRELFNAAGVPAPRAGHAFISLNGGEPRIHVLLEGVNRQFLKRHFTDVTGNVYDGHSAHDVTDRLPTNDGDEPGDQTRLRDLAAAARESDLEKRRVRLESTLDVDRFLTFVALEAILSHWDGYTMNRNNYRIFHDRAQDRMVFLPHGMDQILNRQDVQVFYPRTVGRVARSVLEVPVLRDRYRSRVTELATNVFQPGPIRARLREVAGRLDVLLAESSADAVRAHQRRVATLDRRIQQRAVSLERQLSPAPSVAAVESGELPAMEWRPRVDLGDAQLERETDATGKTLLRIVTRDGCTASWRARSRLPRGRYRLEAVMRTHDVVLDPADGRAGAGLRIGGHRTLPKTVGDHEWDPVGFDFQVQNDSGDVELVCELRANRGTVWFDQRSLKLKRL